MVISDFFLLFRLLLPSILARCNGGHRGLSGLDFDDFGRSLAFKQILAERGLSARGLQGLLNPVSCVRYFEFAYVKSLLDKVSSMQFNIGNILDISSPRLLPFWMVDKGGVNVSMLNPDSIDLQQSKDSSRYIRNRSNLAFVEYVDGTELPFDNNCFDLATSISVIEHIPGNGDSEMIAELVRVVRPGGMVILSFPVKPVLFDEYRGKKYYNREQERDENGRYFFQRYHDQISIEKRILSCSGIMEYDRQYWVETPIGWFDEYEKKWISDGLKYTSRDPELMSQHFISSGKKHPQEGMGICCIALLVNNGINGNL